MLEEVYVLKICGDSYCAVGSRAEAAELTKRYNEEKFRPFMMSEDECYWTFVKIAFESDSYWQVYRCRSCHEIRTWCDGGTDTEFCDRCWNELQRPRRLRWLLRFFAPDRHGCSECKGMTNA